MESDKIINGICWVAYFDILGFQQRVRNFQKWYQDDGPELVAYDIESILDSITDEIQRCNGCNPVEINYVHFSDTFVFFAPDDSISSYLSIDMLVRHFFTKRIWETIPFRGALTVGNFYANLQKNVFVGEALLQAYDYAEKQDWIGFVLTPQAQDKLSGTDIDLRGSQDYIEYDVPIKNKRKPTKTQSLTEKLYAHRFSKYSHTEESVVAMQKESKTQCPEEYERKLKTKYDNTLGFVRDTKL